MDIFFETLGFFLSFFGTFLFAGGMMFATGFFIYKVLKGMQSNNPKPITGERTAIQQDDRVAIIYQIKKDDSEFNANIVEQYIKNYLTRIYPDYIFHTGNFKIIDYAKLENEAIITYKIVATQTTQYSTTSKEFRIMLKMNIKGSDFMQEITKECYNCGAVIPDDGLKQCPYCGHTYQFNKYNKWKIKEIIE